MKPGRSLIRSFEPIYHCVWQWHDTAWAWQKISRSDVLPYRRHPSSGLYFAAEQADEKMYENKQKIKSALKLVAEAI